MCIPSVEAVQASGSHFRCAAWHRHRTDLDYGGQPYEFVNDYQDGMWLSRADVFNHFGQSDRKGVISTIKWGYPKGTARGNCKGFSDAFRSDRLVSAIAELRQNGPIPAAQLIAALNEQVTGISTSTTSKIAYFAGLEATEGACLIYDRMVCRAILCRSDPEFMQLRNILQQRDGDILPYQQVRTYGLYLTAAHAMAQRLGVTGAQIELFLFIGRENAAALPPYY